MREWESESVREWESEEVRGWERECVCEREWESEGVREWEGERERPRWQEIFYLWQPPAIVSVQAVPLFMFPLTLSFNFGADMLWLFSLWKLSNIQGITQVLYRMSYLHVQLPLAWVDWCLPPWSHEGSMWESARASERVTRAKERTQVRVRERLRLLVALGVRQRWDAIGFLIFLFCEKVLWKFFSRFRRAYGVWGTFLLSHDSCWSTVPQPELFSYFSFFRKCFMRSFWFSDSENPNQNSSGGRI